MRRLDIAAEGARREEEKCDFRRGGDVMRVRPTGRDEGMCVGHPTTAAQGTRGGAIDRSSASGDIHPGDIRKPTNAPAPKAVRSATGLAGVTSAKRFRDILSRPEYANDDDVLGALMTHDYLTYDVHGQAFVDEAYMRPNFRNAKIKAGDMRRGQIVRGEI